MDLDGDVKVAWKPIPGEVHGNPVIPANSYEACLVARDTDDYPCFECPSSGNLQTSSRTTAHAYSALTSHRLA